MAITAETNMALNSLNWAQQVTVSGAGNAAAAAATPRTKKGKSEKADESWILGTLFPLAEIQSGIEEGLKASIRDAIATLNGLFSDDTINEALQKLLGHPDDPATIARSLRDLTDAFAELAAAPDKSAQGVIRATAAFTDKLRAATEQVQGLRGKADADIGATVEKANAILAQIADLNTRISLGAAIGQPLQDIGSMRDGALDTLSRAFDFASFARDDGTVSVFTKSGIPLVNGPAARLDHRVTPKITPSMTLANGQLSGIAADGQEISGQITAGALHALLKTRDSTLPNVQSQLDTLAQTLQAQVNQVSNRALALRGINGSCHSSRRFANPKGQYFSLSGGDVMISLLPADGKPAKRIGLSLLMKQYLQAHGLPHNRSWTAVHAAAALDRWLTRHLGSRPQPFAQVDGNGQIAFQLPPEILVGLTFQDQRSFAYRSDGIARTDKPLGLSGPIGFTDSAGNAISTSRASPPRTITPGDHLAAIAGKLAGLDGLETSIEQDGDGFFLRIASTTGSDMSVEPDPAGADVVAGLGLRPDHEQPVEDVVVNFQPEMQGASYTSAPCADALTPLGLQGPLSICDQDGHSITRVAVDPGWSLSTLAARMNDAAGNHSVRVTVVAAGNQVIMKIAAPLGRQLIIAGAPDALHTPPASAFAAGGGALGLALGGVSVGKLTVKAGDTLQAVADAINAPDAPFAAHGIRAALGTIGAASYLEVASNTGLPLSVGGSAAGAAAGALGLRLNVRDSLGLSPPATQVISGFANFLGLNDMFVANPADAYDAKAPTGIFTSTATAGTASAMVLNPLMRQFPALLDNPLLAQQMMELLRGQVNLAAAGGLARGNHNLIHYAETIIATAAAQAQATRARLVYQQTLVDGLSQQHARVGGMDMNDTVTALNAYQQAFHDSSRIVSTMAQLFGSLGAPLH